MVQIRSKYCTRYNAQCPGNLHQEGVRAHKLSFQQIGVRARKLKIQFSSSDPNLLKTQFVSSDPGSLFAEDDALGRSVIADLDSCEIDARDGRGTVGTDPRPEGCVATGCEDAIS